MELMDKIFFNSADLKKVSRMSGQITVISTVCPDYPHNGTRFTFRGELGSGISLTAQEHIKNVPNVIASLQEAGLEVGWQILVADLPELVEEQREFWINIAGSKEEYITRCEISAKVIKSLGFNAETFSSFYENSGVDYLTIQNQVKERILLEVETNRGFVSKFNSFMISRASLAEKFRGRSLSILELKEAAAHGMALYITHGTLLREKFLGKNLVVINHQTTNLQNFFLCNLVAGYESLIDTPKFPLGVIKKDFY